ncbi:MAG: hypothetical protein O2955_12925 [Planctomycetota bacterium]|nr:hypothetical protein [Planctomycetota bacterium]MDA1213412.1 hypothetical protein [Planctomycetota bacterium]
MATDVYQPCPCRSGKKFKFCCHPVSDEMAKIYQSVENGQLRSAIQALEKLNSGTTLYPQVAIEQANLLMQENEYKASKTVLQKLLIQEPNHPLGIALFGMAALLADGIDKARPAVYRAYLHGGAAGSDVTSNMAMFLATYNMLNRQFLAAREHLALSMRLAPENKRQEIFVKLLQFDGDRRIPYPFRSVHPLVECKVSGEYEKAYRRARRYCETGCFAEAHKAFVAVAEQNSEPEVAAPLWHNTGYALAWDGQNEAAADAFHKAAKLYSDSSSAVECETLAQIIDQFHTKDVVPLKSIWHPVESVSRLLTVLDGHDRFRRTQNQEDEQSDTSDATPTAEFDVVDRSVESYSAEKTYTLDDLPVVLARVQVYDRDDQRQLPGRIVLSGYEGERRETAANILQEITGAGIDFTAAHPQDPEEAETYPKELLLFERDWMIPEGTPGKVVLDFEQEHWRRVISDKWPNATLNALGGATPTGVAGDTAFLIPLTAAIYVLDAHCDTRSYHLPIDDVAERLQVKLLPPLEVTEETPLQAITSLGLLRLPLDQLSDKQMAYCLNRILLVHHGRLLYDIFNRVLDRPSCLVNLDLNRLYMTMLELSRERFAKDERLAWIEKGKEGAKTGEKSFERSLEWAMREVVVRVEDPDDPALKPLLQHMWDYYGTKIPDLRQYLTTMLSTLKITPPWEGSRLVTGTGDASNVSGVWSPESQQTPEPGTSKLWMPGQD